MTRCGVCGHAAHWSPGVCREHTGGPGYSACRCLGGGTSDTAAEWADWHAEQAPTAPLDVDRLVQAMMLAGVKWPKTWGAQEFHWVARQIAGAYATDRLVEAWEASFD